MNAYRLLYDVAQRLRGEPVGAVLHALREGRRRSPGALVEEQWARQRALLQHAWSTVPSYRQRMQEIGIAPHEIRAPEDWAALPILEKTDLQKIYMHYIKERREYKPRDQTNLGGKRRPLPLLSCVSTRKGMISRTGLTSTKYSHGKHHHLQMIA
jgi:phenylacetate-CoA ligase